MVCTGGFSHQRIHEAHVPEALWRRRRLVAVPVPRPCLAQRRPRQLLTPWLRMLPLRLPVGIACTQQKPCSVTCLKLSMLSSQLAVLEHGARMSLHMCTPLHSMKLQRG